ncbi:MAG: phosphohydrolase [Rhodoferax sp.]|nr:phosphohydrolase [Rhodoferax sp.]
MQQTKHYDALAHGDWHYIEKRSLESFSASDWGVMNAQRRQYMAELQADQVLRLLKGSEHDPTFGYMVNNYRHCLQSATMALRDGLEEEDVVVALLHDVGFITCPLMHGDFAAALLGAYVSERNHWMLRHHATFQNLHSPNLPGGNPHERERWRGHPHFDWTAEFVARYDQAASDPDYPCEPLETFVPMVRRIFARAPQDRRSIEKETP